MRDGGGHCVRTTAGTAIALAALSLAAPSPPVAVALLLQPASGGDPTGPVLAVVALLAWVLTAWLATTVLLVLLSRLPGLLGHAGRAAAARVAPVTVRRAVEAALGLTVAVGALAPPTALAAPIAGPARAATAGTTWDLDWPARTTTEGVRSRPGAVAPSAGPTAPEDPTVRRAVGPTAAAPTPAAPTAAASTATGPTAARPSVTAHTRTTSATPATTRGAARPLVPAPPEGVPPTVDRLTSAPAPAPVVVQRGDSLWSLAEAALRSTGTADPTDRQVAQAWPRWWAANRAVVGDDPDLLLPGTVLRPPPAGGPGHR